MDARFWLDRWENDEIAFHQEEVNDHLQSLLPTLGIDAGATAFVPLCGKTLDLHWLAQRGHPTIGVEISPVAAQAAFTEHGLTPEVIPQGAFTEYRHGLLRVLCGDFFELEPAVLSETDLVHDRAALVALEPDDRRRYAAKMAELLPSGSVMLLITYDYPPSEMNGPPYSVSDREVEQLYGDAFEITLAREFDGLTPRPRFQRKGLTRLTERVHLLQRR
jgi:thiopurine S-methyltransferase